MRWIGWIGMGVMLASCMEAEALSGPDLEARLADTVLTFAAPSETLVLELRADGTGVATETKDPGEPAATEPVTWRVRGDALCLTAPEGSRIASGGREECTPVSLSGGRVQLGGSDSDMRGTIVPMA